MKVLLIGSSFSAMPFLSELRRNGAEISVIGKYPEDPCHKFADHSIYEDYSDGEALLDICTDGRFDFIVPTCNDYSYVAGSYVANRLGLPGFDTPDVTAIIHTKDRFRQFCVESGAPVPRIYGEIGDESSALALAAKIDGPALVKPVDSFSGRGVQLIQGADELASAANKALETSRSKRAVVEQFVDGALHSHTAFVVDGEIVWHDFIDEYCEVYRYQVDRSAYPSALPAGMRQAVHVCMEGIVRQLGLCDGLLHTQFIASQTEFWIIESMRRCPGDLYGHHFKFAFGYDYEAEFVAGFIGKRPMAPAALSGAPRRIERRVLSISEPAAFFGVSLGASSAEAIYVPVKESGQKIDPAPFDKSGIFFLRGDAQTSRGELWEVEAGMLMHDC